MDFTGKDVVNLFPGTSDYPLSFHFAACSSAVLNDGSIPYGSTISSAVVRVLASNNKDVSAAVASSASVSGGLQVDVSVTHSTTAAKGQCKTYILLTLSTGAVITKQWDGLWIW